MNITDAVFYSFWAKTPGSGIECEPMAENNKSGTYFNICVS